MVNIEAGGKHKNLIGNVFVTSDLHIGHDNIIRLAQRPFVDIHEMHRAIISNWNEIIAPEDTIIMVGDIAFKAPVRLIEKIVSQLNGKKILVIGNHDARTLKTKDLFDEIHTRYEFFYNNKFFVADHYPMESWNQKHRGAIHFHGHTHSHNLMTSIKNRFHIGIDSHKKFRPWKIEEIFDEAAKL